MPDEITSPLRPEVLALLDGKQLLRDAFGDRVKLD